MIKNNTPSISVVMATFNSSRTLNLCLKKVSEQNYPKSKVEMIIADGGSSDNTLQIAKKFGCKIVKIDSTKQNAEYNKGVGLSHASGDIVLFLDHDNIMPHRNWLRKLVEPFNQDKDIIGVEPLRFHYDPAMTMLDRYFALFGGSDPVVYYLGKNSHLSYAYSKYCLLGKAEDKGEYYHVTFAKKAIPALGGNGAALKRKALLKYAKANPDQFIHTDVVADLINKGFNNYAIMKDTIIHLTNNKTLPFLKRRVYFIEKYQLKQLKKRRYRIYDPKKDKLKLFLYIVYSTTLIVPILGSIRGYIKVRDAAWFLHPFMCLAYLVMYAIPVLKGGPKNAILEK